MRKDYSANCDTKHLHLLHGSCTPLIQSISLWVFECIGSHTFNPFHPPTEVETMTGFERMIAFVRWKCNGRAKVPDAIVRSVPNTAKHDLGRRANGGENSHSDIPKPVQINETCWSNHSLKEDYLGISTELVCPVYSTHRVRFFFSC